MNKKIFFRAGFYIFLLFFIFIISVKIVNADGIDMPTVSEINTSQGLYIKGNTNDNTEVMVYIDGKYRDSAIPCLDNENEYFCYQDDGFIIGRKVEVKLIAKDKTSLVLSPPLDLIVDTSEIPSPTLINLEKRIFVKGENLVIKGLTRDNTYINIFVDDKFITNTDILKHESGTANFAYNLDIDFTSGVHKIWATAQTEKGNHTERSNILEFSVAYPTSAPTLLKLSDYFNKQIVWGLAKNDLKIKIYVDDILDGEFNVVNDESGTANFSYKIKKELSRGEHEVFALAIDDTKVSKESNSLVFNKRKPEINQAQEEEKEQAVVEIAVEKKEQEDKINVDKFIEREKEETLDKNILKEETKIEEDDKGEKTEKKGGLVNEDHESETKLNLNLLVFIGFLLLVVFWIVWVNKEIRESNKD